MRNRLLAIVLLVLVMPAHALEFRELASPAGDGSLAPRLAEDVDGRMILTWLQPAGDDHQFRFSRFDDGRFDTGGVITEGNGFFANWADTPGLAVMANGHWLAFWLARSGKGTYAYDVRAALSADQGQHWSAAFSPHDDGTLTEHGFVSTFASGPDGVGMIWLDGRETRPADIDGGGHHGHAQGGAMTLRAARVGASGRLSDGVLVDARVCDCCGTAAAMTDEGPVVVYRDRSEKEVRDIRLVRRSPDGWTVPVLVHDDGWRINACPVNGPAVLARGAVVIVAWFTLGTDDVPRVRVSRSDNAGRTFAAPQTLDAGRALGRVDLAWTGQGYVMAWLAEEAGAGIVRLARFDRDGVLAEQHDLVQIETGRSSGFPRLASLDDDRLLVAWTEQRVRVGVVSGWVSPTPTHP